MVVKRKGQRVEWMWKMTMEDIQFIIRTLPGVDTLIDKLEHVCKYIYFIIIIIIIIIFMTMEDIQFINRT